MSNSLTKKNGRAKRRATPAADELLVTLIVDGETIRIKPKDLTNAASATEILERCNAATRNVQFKLNNLLDLDAEGRFALLRLAQNTRRCNYGVDGEASQTALDAIVRLHVDSADITALQKWKRAALEIAALFYADVPQLACGKIRDRMKALGFTGGRPDDLVRDTKKILKEMGRGLAEAAVPVGGSESWRYCREHRHRTRQLSLSAFS